MIGQISSIDFYTAAEIDIDSGRDVSIYMHHGKYPDKSTLVLYKPLLHCNNILNSPS